MNGFAESLGRHLEQLQDYRRRGASEDSIRDLFLSFLRDSFPRLDQAEPILLEKHIPGLRVRGGYADILYGDLIFECKRRLDDATRAEGQEELARYIGNQEHSERYFGVLTDGETLEVYALRDGRLENTDELQLALERAEDAYLWLDCYLFHDKQLAPTADDVARRFGELSPTFLRSLRILEELWQRIGAQAGAQTKFAEWQSLLSIVYGSEVGDEGLFLRHTYLALFARVLAFVALERHAPNTEELRGIFSGATFERMGFENFVGDDFFTWVDDQVRGLLQAIATRLTAAYDLNAIREDLLKELYQELVDPQTRRDLGEFYTPDWLAELTLRTAGFPPSDAREPEGASLLDPACGSGTFLFTAVRLLREGGRKGKSLVEFCAQHMAGLDVHPLAVTIAKTNLLLALGDDVRGYPARFAIPIYMADTLTRTDRRATEPEIQIPVEMDQISRRAEKPKPRGLPNSFGVPAQLADHPAILHAALDAVLRFAHPDMGQEDAVLGFRSRLKELDIPDTQLHQWEANLDLMRWLLSAPATNSVWRFILYNACQPELLARRKFAYVVGNPPWLAYYQIKRRDYQERVRALASTLGLVQKRHLGLLGRTELATLFFAFCGHTYVVDGGTLAFVMPRSVLTGAKQHADFRKRYVCACESLIDCERVSPLFNVPSCVLIWVNLGNASSVEQVTSVLRLQGQLPSRNLSLHQAEKHLTQTHADYVVPTTQEASPYWERMIQGADIIPRCFWFVRPPESARIVDRQRPHLETDVSLERQAKKPWKGIRLQGSVEAKFLFATLLSSNMLPFGWRMLSLVLLPLTTGARGLRRLLNADEALRLGRMGLFEWLRKAEPIWRLKGKRSELVPSIYDRLNYLNKLAAQRSSGVVKMMYGAAGTHVCACVADVRDIRRWRIHELTVQGFVADQTTYWFETTHPYEAHYLCAVLNAPLVDEAIKPYQTKGLFGAHRGKGERHIHRRPFEVLPIPRFDGKDRRHRELAQLSQRCHEKVGEAVANADERFFKAPIGRLRTQLRKELLEAELAQINDLVAEILKSP